MIGRQVGTHVPFPQIISLISSRKAYLIALFLFEYLSTFPLYEIDPLETTVIFYKLYILPPTFSTSLCVYYIDFGQQLDSSLRRGFHGI